MPQGQVKWFDPKKGYGFIIGPEGQDVFVHYSHIQAEGFRALKDGEWVDYELVKGDKGWQAREVFQGSEAGSAAASPSGRSAASDGPPRSRGYESPNGSTAGSAGPQEPRSSGYEGADGRIG